MREFENDRMQECSNIPTFQHSNILLINHYLKSIFINTNKETGRKQK